MCLLLCFCICVLFSFLSCSPSSFPYPSSIPFFLSLPFFFLFRFILRYSFCLFLFLCLLFPSSLSHLIFFIHFLYLPVIPLYPPCHPFLSLTPQTRALRDHAEGQDYRGLYASSLAQLPLQTFPHPRFVTFFVNIP